MHSLRTVFLLLLLGAPLTGVAAEVDQEFTGPGTAANAPVDQIFPRAQTFSVGLEGRLDRIDLSLARGGSTLDTDELTIDVRPADQDGAPLVDDGSSLATVAIAATQLTEILDPEDLYEIDLRSFAILVQPGDRLAIVARSNVPFFPSGRAFAFEARRITGEGYPGGSAWFRPSPEVWQLQGPGDVDLVFRTWVPEPGAAASALAAFAVLGQRARRGSSTSS